jgi:type III pantothenate kinase
VNILALDIGNTFTKVALFKGQRVRWRASRATHALLNKTAAREFIDDIQAASTDIGSIDALGASSVVPDAAKVIVASMERAYRQKAVEVSATLTLPFRVDYKTPTTLGADRLAVVARASERYKNAVIAINIGTAITYDVLISSSKTVGGEATRRYLGGLIVTGVGLRAAALHRNTAQLPMTHFQTMRSLIGTSTEACLAAGLYFGVIAEISGIVTRLKADLEKRGEKSITVFAAGGDALHVAKAVNASEKVIDAIEPDAVLRGVRRLTELQVI